MRTVLSAVVCAVAVGIAAGAPDDGWAAPEGRAYELVSTENTDNAAALAVRASDDGDTILLAHDAMGDDIRGVPQFALVLARRSETGWSARAFGSPTAIPLPDAGAVNALPKVPADDLSGVVMESTPPLDAGDTDGTALDVYALFADGGPARWISFGPTVPDALPGFANLAGAAADLGTVVFRHDGSLLPAAPAGQLYARRGDGLVAVSILPDGTFVPGAISLTAPLGAESGHDGTTTSVDLERPHRGPGVVSSDGSRVFFYGGVVNSAIYMRDLAAGTTVAVTASKRPGEESNPPANGRFVAATDDGKAVVFLSNAQLTPDAPPNGGLYRYDVDTDTLAHLVPNPNNSANGGAFFAVASDDLSHVYFISSNALDPNASGSRNLYVWSAGGVRLIAPNVGTNTRIARVSRDGRYAVFTSTASLGGAPNGGKAAIYLYDAEGQNLACASCRPDGAPSQFAASLSLVDAGQFPTLTSDRLVKPRNLTDDGRVYFETDEALTDDDVNTTTDVYEYDHGTTRLISAGTGSRPSFLGDNSDDGRTVFIMTHDALVPADRDAGAVDVYAVRVGGGFPESPAPVPCEGDACQGPFRARPPLHTPNSWLPGLGNVVPPPDAPRRAMERAVRIEPLSATVLRSAARRGVLTVHLRVTGGGTVRLKATARLRGRARTVGSITSVVKQTRALTRTVRIRLSAAARGELRRGKRVRVTLVARLSGVAGVHKRAVTLARKGR